MELDVSNGLSKAGSLGLNRSNSPNEFPIIQEGDRLLVNAKILHHNLSPNSQFRDWINYRISEYGFIEGQDYFAEKFHKSQGRPSISYTLTLDMAKELAMLERSETGRFFRRYFIQREKELLSLKKQTLITSPTALFQGLKSEKINGRKLFPFREMLRRLGYYAKSSASNWTKRNPNHFVKLGDRLLVTEEYARHMAASKAVYDNRKVIKEMQPVLALDFSNPQQP